MPLFSSFRPVSNPTLISVMPVTKNCDGSKVVQLGWADSSVEILPDVVVVDCDNAKVRLGNRPL